MKSNSLIACCVLAAWAIPSPCATRLKDIVSLEGVRDNQLMGYGLVVGLAGTGDRRQTLFSAQSLTNLLERMGLSVPAMALQVKNTAAVMVTSTLPPFGQPGSRIDVTAAAIGDAPSLQGGILLMTGLKGPDGQVYAVAQGPLVLGGYAAGNGMTTQVVNHPTVGRIPNGAIIERPSPAVNPGVSLHLQLQRADYTTASRVEKVLNEKFGDVAHADNAGVVTVVLPAGYRNKSADFIAELEKLTVEQDHEAKIVVNERTGTIVMGKDVHIAPVALMQGNLTVEIQTTFGVSQPNAFTTGGTTQVVPQTTVGARQEPTRNVVLKQGATVEELVRALTAIGSSPRDIIAILQNLKSAGALEAVLEVI
ncbi:MAG: flagellar basal body P-ring protein FlgI [Acidobacteria bacterium]|nr:flagellar basal body P-ring protein FlgI [Acidobacteriota bacterium]